MPRSALRSAPRVKSHPIRLPTPSGTFCPFYERTYQRNMMRAYRTEWNEERKLYLPASLAGAGVWHRGAGKGMTVTGGVLIPAMAARPGNYMHAFPSYSTAKKALWSENWWKAMWPPDWSPQFKETELCVEMVIGGVTARLWLVGADDRAAVDKLRSTNPFGVVYDEASEMDEEVTELSARLYVNGGWDLLLFTPKGRKWSYKRYIEALARDDFYSELITIDDSRCDAVDLDGKAIPGENGQPVVGPEMVELMRSKGKSEEWIAQEFMCSFNASLIGTIYGDRLTEARKAGRIGRVPYDPDLAVGVWLDIGYDDPTAMVFYQVKGPEIRIIDYEARRGLETGETIAFLLNKPYRYAKVTLPWDAEIETANAPDSMASKFRKRMRCRIQVNPKIGARTIGIDLVRAKFARFVFDEVACSRQPATNLPSLLDSLSNYRYGWNVERQDNSGPPVHDQYSHGADAVRCGIEGWKEDGLMLDEDRQPIRITTAFDVFERDEDRDQRRTSKLRVVSDFDAFGRRDAA